MLMYVRQPNQYDRKTPDIAESDAVWLLAELNVCFLSDPIGKRGLNS